MDKRIRFSTDPFLRPVAIGLSLWLVSAVALAEVESGSALSAIESDPESYPTIRSVQVETNNVFSDSLAAKSWVYRLINRLHIRTRTHVIDREILLKEGERYDADLAYETERTLRGLPYIYDAEVALDSSNTDSVVLRVRTIDKWSISGGVQVVRQPGRSRVDVGAKETNLLGIGQTVELKHIFSNPDPDYFVFGYFDPRLLGSFHRLEFRVNDNPFQRERRFAFARRFVRRQDRFAYEFTLSDFRERELKFNNGDTTLTFFQEGDRIKVGFVGRRGGYHDKLTTGVVYEHLNLRTPEIIPSAPYALNGRDSIRDSRDGQSIAVSLPADSVFHFFGGSLDFRRTDFYRTRRIGSHGRTEDVVFSSGAGLLFGQARGRSLEGLIYNLWRLEGFVGGRAGNLLIKGNLSRQAWRSHGAEIRSVSGASVTAFHNGLSWLTFASRLKFLSDKRADQLDALSVDENAGVRGYRENFLTGDRSLVGNLEARFFSDIQILTARIGAATHFDFGGAWDRDRALRFADLIWSGGAGLRIDLGRAGGGRVVRLDLTYAGQQKDWHVSTSIGQFFNLNGR